MTDTKLIGTIMLQNAGELVVLVSPLTDATSGEITVRDLGGNLVNLKDKYVGDAMESYDLTVGTPSDLDLIQFLDDNGGILHEWGGAINAPLGQVPQSSQKDLHIPITKGCSFKATTSD